jgi:citrate lyase subunit beta/citryl-CoA lyase
MLGPIRSILFVPGARPDRFAKAEAAGADAVVFDLEDSVDAAGKQAAREAIAAYLSSASNGTARIVRFNAATSAEGERDIAFFHGKTGFDAIVLPKIEGADVVEQVARAFSHRDTPTPIIPLIETPLGILRALDIVTAQAQVPAILFGAEDLTARLGTPRTVDGDELLFARGQLAMAAALVDAEAIDAVYTNVKDLAALRRDAERARGLGFRGKMAIHPAQIPVIHEVFTPSPADVERARRVVAAWDAAQAAGEAITRLGDEMIELPIVERARRVLARARA